MTRQRRATLPLDREHHQAVSIGRLADRAARLEGHADRLALLVDAIDVRRELVLELTLEALVAVDGVIFWQGGVKLGGRSPEIA